ncbi:hypothetical protein FS595_08870 [Serratia rubidaea]|uniref:YlcI/YnfO family protein n=1 Tax=Serratia rubidaea TaxID=61652 RepID=UPI001F1E616D|nr:YlcI/YnfO family protein [Serratia rubidaea]UJD79804.1 hypothetical protein FS596_08870 [Serratia rubidaea]UJD84360.1 hypothetical protein FS595_08870 [Serratia rubidaea]
MVSDEKNTKSKVLASRVPRELIEEMEAVKLEGESTTHFVVAAMRAEIMRRRTEGGQESPLLSSLDALARVETLGIKAMGEIERLINIAQKEIDRRQSGTIEGKM